MVAMWLLQSNQRTKASVTAAALGLVSSVLFVALSLLEHSKSLHGSVLLNVYLLFSILFDATRARTLWNMSFAASITIPFTVSLGLKILILSLEEINKTRYIAPSEKSCGPEETAGVFSRSLLLWLNKLIFAGFSNILGVDNLPQIDRRLRSEALWTSFGARWESCKYTRATTEACLYAYFHHSTQAGEKRPVYGNHQDAQMADSCSCYSNSLSRSPQHNAATLDLPVLGISQCS